MGFATVGELYAAVQVEATVIADAKTADDAALAAELVTSDALQTAIDNRSADMILLSSVIKVTGPVYILDSTTTPPTVTVLELDADGVVIPVLPKSADTPIPDVPPPAPPAPEFRSARRGR